MGYGILNVGTAPSAGVHPRICISDVNGPTLATIRNRVTTGASRTHRKYYNGLNNAGNPDVPNGTNLTSYCNARLDTSPTKYPNTYYYDGSSNAKEAEYSAALAFSYLMDNANTAHAARAREIALYFAGAPQLFSNNGHDGRQVLISMALIYTWLYSYLSSGDRATIRNALGGTGKYIDNYRYRNTTPFTDEKMWGEAHGDGHAAIIGLLAIIKDGSAGENTTWDGWLDTAVDGFDDGTNTSFFASFRTFGNTDGGTNKGSGPWGYDTRNEEFYYKFFSAMKSCLNIDWGTTENWWQKGIHWKLWQWRQDRSFFRQGENLGISKYSLHTEAHALQVADNNANTYGEHAQWLADEIDSLQRDALWGPYQIWNILLRNTSRVAIQPSVDRMGARYKLFKEAGTVSVRDGWGQGDVSIISEAPPYFTGGHTQRCAGNFMMAVNGFPIFIKNGHYDANQTTTYKDPADSTKTGHRFTYARRAVAHNVLRIVNDAEVSGNTVDSFQNSLSSTSRFGVKSGSTTLTGSDISNSGDLLVPKNLASSPTLFQPRNWQDVLDTSRWQFPTYIQDPIETTAYTHWLWNLKNWYWTNKFPAGGFYRRHFLWINKSQIPGWPYSCVLIFDDALVNVNTSNPTKTTIYQLQSQYAPTYDAANRILMFTNGTGRAFHYTVRPTSISRTEVIGFIINGVTYPGTNIKEFDDSWDDATETERAHRQEISPTVAGGAVQYVSLICPCPSSVASGPEVIGFEDATSIGAIINGITCSVTKSAPYTGFVGTVTPPPTSSGIVKVDTSIYSGQNLSAGGGPTTSAWQDVQNSYETQLNIKLTNSTGITIAARIQVEVTSSDTSGRSYKFLKPFISVKTASASRSMSITIPIGVEFFRLVITHPVGGSATVDAEFSKVTSM